ncbi:MAG TPA: hypothetical protein DCX06_00520 [Opitutae bacterium]|nr:hypothetical protein [Opitutae bacterium]
MLKLQTTTYLFLLLPIFLAQATPRAPIWKPERLLGSANLELASMQYIVLPAGAPPKVQAAVEDLLMVISDRMGINLERCEPAALSTKHSIILSLREPIDSTGGFMIQLERTNVRVSASSHEGLANGIYQLCKDVFGARWYWSGELGLEYVGEVPNKLPRSRWFVAPAFIQRAMTWVDRDYSRRNRLNQPFQFNHALANVFTPELYENDPEVFAMVKGSRPEPKGHRGTDAQPNLAHPRAVEIAAEAALSYFKKHPSALSFSLSINDNILFDESGETQALVTPLKYFRQRPDYTDYVFGFMNAVAEKVFNEAGAWKNANGEERYLTALAYYWTEPSPSIRLHPRVMPVLTSDRAQWHDPEYRNEDEALIRRWSKSGAERIATWDYYFGAPYPYPRQLNQWIAESLRCLNKEGVDVFFSELSSTWGMDGAKAWLSSELLWDPEQDAEALLDEFYTHFFGAAAEDIRSFYETAEQHRNENEGKADWIKFYKDEAGIGLFSKAVLMQMRASLEAAKQAVQGDMKRSARVQIVSDAFSLTEAYAEFHQARLELIQGSLDHSPDLKARLNSYRAKRAVYRKAAAEVVAGPMHARLKTFTRQMQTNPEPLALVGLSAMGNLSEAEDKYGLIDWRRGKQVFRSVLDDVTLPHIGTYRLNFLGPDLPRVDRWFFDLRPYEHLNVTGIEGASAGVRIEGADIVSFFRDVPVLPERSYLLDTKIAWNVSPDNRTQMKLVWKDDNGKVIRTDKPLQLPWGHSDGVQRLILPFNSPKKAYDMRIHLVTSRQYEGDFLEVHELDFGVLVPR